MPSAIQNINTWPQTVVQCPHCDSISTSYDPGQSKYFGCQKCGTFYEKRKVNHEEIKHFKPLAEMNTTFVPGETCVIDGVTYVVAGVVSKSARDGSAEWMEYLLYNPKYDWYHTLAEYNGHWMLVWHENKHFKLHNTASPGVSYEVRTDRPYRRFNPYASYQYYITGALGEFDWDLLTEADYTEVDEYTDPPNIVVHEKNGENKEWFYGRHMDRDELCDAFRIDKSRLPKQTGSGALELPSPFRQAKPLRVFTVIFCIIIIATAIVISVFKPNEQVYDGTFIPNADTTGWAANSTIHTDQFEIKSDGAVEITLSAELSNEWLELNAELVNDTTGQTYEINAPLLYYTGIDVDGKWVEDERKKNRYLARVPAGKYHMNIFQESENKKPYTITLSINRNVGFASNAILLMVIALVWPFIQLLRREGYALEG